MNLLPDFDLCYLFMPGFGMDYNYPVAIFI